MKILVSGRHTNTLQDIRAAVAAAKAEGNSKMSARVTVDDMKAGIARSIRNKHGRR